MPAYDDDDDDDDDDRRRSRDDDGRRRRSRDDDYYNERDDYDDDLTHRRDPRDRLLGPGRSLMIIGALGTAFSIIIPIIVVIVQLNEPRKADTTELMVMTSFFGLLSALYFGFIGIGGLKMLQGQGYGLAMAAAILAITSLACVGIFSFVILPFGIWAIVVLCDRDVKKVFNRSRRRSLEDDYDEYR